MKRLAPGRWPGAITEPHSSARQPEPSALVLNESSCYHFRVLDPRAFAAVSATLNVATIGCCYYS